MRKKWTYVAIVSMMLGVAPVFTGCVDTDEPAGIEELRGAKAELLRAQAVVQQAKAAILQAKVALVEAYTRERNAIALQQEMEAEKRRLENEWKQLANEEKRAQVEREIAFLEQKMAEQALEHEKTMLEKQAALEKAKREYELTMQAIEIAEAIGSDKVKVTLTSLKEAVEEAYAALYEGGNGKDSLEEKLYKASKALYVAMQNKAAGYDTDEEGNRMDGIKGQDKEYWPATLLAIKEQKEVELGIKQEALKALQDAAELPVEDTDWRNQVDAMKAEIDALVAERDNKKVELEEAEANPEYIDAWQAAYGVFKATPSEIGDTETEVYNYLSTNPSVKPSKNGALQDRDAAKGSLDYYKENTDIPFAAYSLPESIEGVSDVVMEALGFTQSGDPKKNKEFFSWTATTYKWLDDQSQPADSAELPQTIQDHLGWSYNKWLDALDKAVIKPNDIAYAEAELAALTKVAEDAKKNYDDAVADWQDVKDIISSQKNYTEIDKSEFQASVKAYNAAYDALATAVDNYNKGLEAAWDDAYEAKRDALIFGDILNDQDVIDAFGNAANATAAADAWTSYPGEKNSATFESFIIANYARATATQTKAEVEKAVKDAMTLYVNEIENDREWAEDNKADLEAAAQGGVNTFIAAEGVPNSSKGTKGDKSLAAIVDAAKAGLNNAYKVTSTGKTSLVDAVKNFATSAKGFAQKTAATLNAVTLVKSADATAVNENWYAAKAATAQVGGYNTYTVLNTKVEDSEATGATAVTFNPDWRSVKVVSDTYAITFKDNTPSENYSGLNALEYRSYLAFGLFDRYAVAEKEEVENINSITKNGASVKGQSKAEIYWAAVDKVDEQQATIDAQDDLKELQTVLTDAKEAFLEQIAKDYEEYFGEQQAAYTAALAAYEKAVANLSDVRKKLFGELDAEIDRLTAEIKANRDVYKKLKELAWKYLNITWPEESGDPDDPYTQPDPDNKYNPDEFATQLKQAIARQQVIVAEAEQAVQEAQVNYDQATSGEYDGVHYFQFKLDQIQREWDRAYADYEEAMENLEKGLAIAAEEVDQEQPAE